MKTEPEPPKKYYLPSLPEDKDPQRQKYWVQLQTLFDRWRRKAPKPANGETSRQLAVSPENKIPEKNNNNDDPMAPLQVPPLPSKKVSPEIGGAEKPAVSRKKQKPEQPDAIDLQPWVVALLAALIIVPTVATAYRAKLGQSAVSSASHQKTEKVALRGEPGPTPHKLKPEEPLQSTDPNLAAIQTEIERLKTAHQETANQLKRLQVYVDTLVENTRQEISGLERRLDIITGVVPDHEVDQNSQPLPVPTGESE
jgi:hypothetical protein